MKLVFNPFLRAQQWVSNEPSDIAASGAGLLGASAAGPAELLTLGSGFSIDGGVLNFSGGGGGGLSNPLTADLDCDSYDITDAGTIYANVLQLGTGQGVFSIAGTYPDQWLEIRPNDYTLGFAIGLGGTSGTARDVWPTTQAAGNLHNDGTGVMTWEPGGGPSAGVNLEFQVSDGSGGFVASGIETTTATSPGPHIRPIGDGATVRIVGADSAGGMGGSVIIDGGVGGGGNGSVQISDGTFAGVRFSAGKIQDSSGVDSIHPDRMLYRSDIGTPVAVFDWNNMIAYDATGVASSEMNMRQLVGTDGTTLSLDWANRGLVDSTGNTCASWGSYTLNDAGGSVSIDWGNRQLKSLGTVVFDWSTQEAAISDLSTSTGDSNVDATNAVVNSVLTVMRNKGFVAI